MKSAPTIHAGHEHNERCDKLAREAIAKMRQQHRPEQLKALVGEFKRQAERERRTRLYYS